MLGKVILHLHLFSAGIGKVENEMYSKFYYNRFYYLTDTLTLRGITPCYGIGDKIFLCVARHYNESFRIHWCRKLHNTTSGLR